MVLNLESRAEFLKEYAKYLFTSAVFIFAQNLVSNEEKLLYHDYHIFTI